MSTQIPVARPHAAPRGDCPPCCGTGYEPQLNKRTGQLSLVGCFWCTGTGWQDMTPGPATCPCCGSALIAVGGDGVCDHCTRFETAGTSHYAEGDDPIDYDW